MASPVIPDASSFDLTDQEWDVLLAIGAGEPSLPVDLASLARLEQVRLVQHCDTNAYTLTEQGWSLYESRWGKTD